MNDLSHRARWAGRALPSSLVPASLQRGANMAEEEASDLNLLVVLSAELEEAALRNSAKFIEDAVTAAGKLHTPPMTTYRQPASLLRLLLLLLLHRSQNLRTTPQGFWSRATSICSNPPARPRTPVAS